MADSQPNASVGAFLDMLLPGNPEWPAATIAFADPGAFLTVIAEPERTWLLQAAAQIEAQPPGARLAAMQMLEKAEPVMFARVLQALYRAYYDTEAARRAALRLAEAGPVEQSPLFDMRLLERGKR